MPTDAGKTYITAYFRGRPSAQEPREAFRTMPGRHMRRTCSAGGLAPFLNGFPEAISPKQHVFAKQVIFLSEKSTGNYEIVKSTHVCP